MLLIQVAATDNILLYRITLVGMTNRNVMELDQFRLCFQV
jgi:hypothetical protein